MGRALLCHQHLRQALHRQALLPQGRITFATRALATVSQAKAPWTKQHAIALAPLRRHQAQETTCAIWDNATRSLSLAPWTKLRVKRLATTLLWWALWYKSDNASAAHLASIFCQHLLLVVLVAALSSATFCYGDAFDPFSHVSCCLAGSSCAILNRHDH